ncbi:hypothetical protein Pint_22397 [Pistacia integerrima]|uniref:Uncharacterized protein n=1 Tax=Pistacia integerrima TaxID=434235 RepID=A0ACC0YKC4_9ROSI|nr:hypothetical protein Pint_22397 [Pistacia integerrima]
MTSPFVTVRFGYFSGPLSLTLLASIFWPPPLFLAAYFIIIITSPCHGMLWNLLKSNFHWFILILRHHFSPFVITCTQQQEDHNWSDPEAQTHPQNLPGLEPDLVVVIASD